MASAALPGVRTVSRHTHSRELQPHFKDGDLLHVAEDEVQAEQARRFARQLQDAGSEVLIIPANSKTRDTIDQELGIREDTTSLALMAFLRAKL